LFLDAHGVVEQRDETWGFVGALGLVPFVNNMEAFNMEDFIKSKNGAHIDVSVEITMPGMKLKGSFRLPLTLMVLLLF